MEYPINVFTKVYRQGTAESYQMTADFGNKYDWDNMVEHLEKSTDLINRARLPTENEPSVSLFTPLHYAAEGKAPKEIFEALLKLGASKCLKSADGETPYDIGKRQGLAPEILELIKIPKEIKQNESSIKAMEAGLHQVIKERVEDLINKNGQQLPQLAFLFEKGNFYYPVPGMYGGFSVSEHEKGIQADSWIRVCGGSEQNHLIERNGKVTLLPNDNPL